MTWYISLMTGCALTLTSAAAYADCKSELAVFEAEAGRTGGGISKDGTLAPLQEAPAATGTAGSATEAPSATDTAGAAKDGSGTPLNASPGQAMSGQDAQAQQSGGKTAAETADKGTAKDHSAAVEKARAALAAGDEAACLEALKEGKAG
ncbi:hypothetical protein [Falsigemmobacter faecalis]|uniref:Uncharacterized protein n=1 Tax=Falsigemmobacter faecalis TaxID=2488730 RepID=A0A3P3DVF5_9RHOB|nr:hypothetical protein [Falsigemmobacter faecalis]RRH78267.1 hypothetical protein EG244_02145 [Falsigemmobacter faecalis]